MYHTYRSKPKHPRPRARTRRKNCSLFSRWKFSKIEHISHLYAIDLSIYLPLSNTLRIHLCLPPTPSIYISYWYYLLSFHGPLAVAFTNFSVNAPFTVYATWRPPICRPLSHIFRTLTLSTFIRIPHTHTYNFHSHVTFIHIHPYAT